MADESSLSWYWMIFVDVISTFQMIFYYIFKSWIEFFYVRRKNLSGEVIFLTGAAGGFGTHLAKKLAKKGCTMILVDINKEELDTLANCINESTSHPKKAFPFRCDVSKIQEIEDVAKQIVSIVGHPTMIINNAGVVAGKYLLDLSHEEILHTFNVNTFAHYSIVKQFLPHMLEQNYGHIVSVSSILALDSVAGVADYGPSKAAATAFMHSLRQELRLLNKDKIFCTNVLPYKASTEMFKGVKSRFKRFPLLQTVCPNYLTDKIIEAIEKNQMTLYVPRICYLAISLMHILPERAFDYVYDFLNVNESMRGFTGRKKEN